MQGTVLRAQSGFFWVQTDAGLLECRLRGRLKKERQSSDIAVIGDLVDVKQVSPTTGAIEAVEPRRTKLARRAAGSQGRLERGCADRQPRPGAADLRLREPCSSRRACSIATWC